VSSSSHPHLSVLLIRQSAQTLISRCHVNPKSSTKPKSLIRVDGRGVPISPFKDASGYNNDIGVFVRETVNITCRNLRAKQQVDIQEVLFNKLFNRYSFNFDGDDEQSMHIKKIVKNNALKMMTKALSTWRTMANSKKDENLRHI
jgi:hypothetical protein